MNFKDIFNYIDNKNSFLIVENNTKSNIIKIKSELEISHKSLYQFNIFSIDEFIELVTFSYNDNIFLDNIIETPISIIKAKLKFAKYNLNNSNKDLDLFLNTNKKHINYNKTFINNINKFQFYGLCNDLMIKPFIEKLNLNYEKIVLNTFHTPVAHVFETKKEEVFYLFEQISKLLNEGININDIYIANIDESYYTEIIRIQKFYNIPVELNFNIKLYDISFVKEMFKYDFNTILSLLESNDKLKEEFSEEIKVDEEFFFHVTNKIITIINKYSNNYDPKLLKKIILDDLKQTIVKPDSLTDKVQVIEPTDITGLSSESHVFILNAKYESFPAIAKNNEYLSDLEKEVIDFPTSSVVNTFTNEYYSELVKLKEVKYLSYSKYDKYNSFDPSDIISSYLPDNVKTTKVDLKDITTGYGIDYYKSHFNNKNQDVLLTTFTGEFNFTNKEQLSSYIKDNNITLTPSSISTYFKIPFIYYVERILKISRFKISVNLNIGNFFHSLVESLLILHHKDKGVSIQENQRESDLNTRVNNYLENKVVSNDFDYETYFDEYFNLYFYDILESTEDIDIKTLFFTMKIKDRIINALKFTDDIVSHETKLLKVEKNIGFGEIKGKADLVRIFENDTYSITDFKTSKRAPFNKNSITEVVDQLLNNEKVLKIESLDLLQPTFYAYMFSKENPGITFKDVGFLSFLEDDIKINALNSGSAEKEFYIGANRNERIIDPEALNELLIKIEQLIEQTNDNILNAKFDIAVLKDINNKKQLENDWYSIYEAIAFYNKIEEEDGDEAEAY